MQFSVPAFLQVERGQYKSLLECNYHEFVSALMRENEPIREAQLSRLLRAKRDEWLAAPHILLADILLQHPGAQIRIRDWAIISESIAAAQRDIEGIPHRPSEGARLRAAPIGRRRTPRRCAGRRPCT
jgi:hypothetical protein